MNKLDYKEIVAYKSFKRTIHKFNEKAPYPNGLDKEGKRSFRAKCNRFQLKDDVLFYASTNSSSLRRVITKAEVPLVIKELHCGMSGGHFGIVRTKEKVQQLYFWDGMSTDIEEFVSKCESCQINQQDTIKAKAPLQPIITKERFELFAIDLTGPFKPAKSGNKFICVVTEYATKWAEAYTIPNKSAYSVYLIMKKIISRYGCFGRLLSDQGNEFRNELMTHLLHHFGIYVTLIKYRD
jgi:hypothetical protein